MIKNISYVAVAISLLMLVTAFAVRKPDKSDLDTATEVIVMRNIGHQVLLNAGDSTSRVGTVRRISASEFQIPFEQSFTFRPESLVAVINRVITDSKLPSKYVVNVMESQTNKMIYGYAMLGPDVKNVIPCLGRSQPELPYYIDIKFEERKAYPVKSLYMGGLSLLVIGLLTLGADSYKRRRQVSVSEPESNMEETINDPAEEPTTKTAIPIGKYLFYAEDRVLKLDGEDTALTDKESKILLIFASAPNEIIDRKRLQKEIWEDEGVIVGRSLDMFISRLRKKLENDPDIRIANIHGKGYRLEIGVLN